MSTDLQFWATAIYVASAVLLFLIVLFISYRIVRGLLRLVFGANSLFGSDGRVKLITLGVSALLFSEVLPALFIAFVNTISALFLNTSQSLLERWRNNIGFCTSDRKFECMSFLGGGFVQAFNEGLANAFERIISIPVHRTLLLLATWAILSLIVSQAQQAEAVSPGSSRIMAWFRSGYANSSSPAFANVVFFLILAVGAYLSTAAIAAIPGLQEKSAVFQEVGPEKLKAQLEEALAAFDKYPTEIGTKDPLASLRSYLTTLRADTAKPANTKVGSTENNQTPGVSPTPTPSPTPAPAPSQSANNNSASAGQPASNSNVNSNTSPPTGENNPVAVVPTALNDAEISVLELIANNWEKNRTDLLQTYSTLVKSVRIDQTNAKNTAVRSYEVGNLDRKGNKERVQYFLALSDWFNQRSATADRELTTCIQSIQSLDSSLQQTADTIPALVKIVPSKETLFMSGDISKVFLRARQDCPQAIALDPYPPRRPQLGESSYLGPFAFVASWLLRTESLPLALITGLLGFGLLGSACSTFVREQLNKRQEAAALVRAAGGNPAQVQPQAVTVGDGRLVKDLTGVIIRGLLAAVVVFLAVEGGLAIFASGGGEPNPYVLLLTCLIAAVFSEQVWKWAENKLADTLGSEKKSADDKAVAGGKEGEVKEQVQEAAVTSNTVDEIIVIEKLDEAPDKPPDIGSEEASDKE